MARVHVPSYSLAMVPEAKQGAGAQAGAQSWCPARSRALGFGTEGERGSAREARAEAQGRGPTEAQGAGVLHALT